MPKLLQHLLLIALVTGITGATFAPAAEQARSHDDIVDVAVNAGSFTTLVKALKAADLVDVLRGDGPFTVFAPTDEAFAKLPQATLRNLLKPENKAQLAAILTYHVVPGRILSTDLLGTASAKTVNGQRVGVGLRVGDATVIDADIKARNGVIHVIDTVLLPPEDAAQASPGMDLINLAIQRGARLYNNGQTEACAAIYEVTANALMQMADVPQSAHRSLQRALRQMERTHSMDRRAWIMREGLDEAYAAMSAPKTGR